MKNILTVLLIAGILLMIPFTASAVDTSKMPGESVYASVAEQNEVYDIIQNSDNLINFLKRRNLSLLKESITPYYTVDFLAYAETGEFKLSKMGTASFIDGIPTEEGESIYLAKTVIENEFAGNIIFYMEDGVAQLMMFTPSALLDQQNTSAISISYADHAERIAKLANKETFFPASAVRYAVVDRVGEVFYVNDGKTEMLVVISAAGDVFYGDKGEIAYINDELRKKANERLEERKQELAEIEEWKAAHPDEEYTFTGGGFKSMYGVKSEDVNDITNISKYLASNTANDTLLSIGITEASNSKETSSTGISAIVLVIISFVAVLIATTIIIIRKRNQQS